jgi:hypothetical protein
VSVTETQLVEHRLGKRRFGVVQLGFREDADSHGVGYDDFVIGVVRFADFKPEVPTRASSEFRRRLAKDRSPFE